MTRSRAIDLLFAAWQFSPLYGVGLVVFTLGGALLAPSYAGWASGLPTFRAGVYVLDAVLFLVAFDFVEYWAHRYFHTRAGWWAHWVHHSCTDLWPLASYRNHPALLALQELWRLPLVVLLGGAEHAWWFVPLYAGQQLLAHTGRPWTLGPVGWLVVSPAWHAVHHSSLPRHRDRNFGSILSVWDRAFGTACEEVGAWPSGLSQ